jgi:anthranilate/para-aminobenzoate synthase component I
LILRLIKTSESPAEIFLRLKPQFSEGFFLSHWGDEPFSYFGFTPTRVLSGLFAQYQNVADQLNCQHDLPDGEFPFKGGWCGLLGYNMAQAFEDLNFKNQTSDSLPDFHFGFYPEVFVYDHRNDDVFLIGQNPERIAELKKCYTEARVQTTNFTASDLKTPINRAQFSQRVERCRQYIAAGDIFQANLSHPLFFKIKGDPAALYQRALQSNPSPYDSVYFTPKFQLLSNSPELLFKIRDHQVVTKPIAGTRRRGRDATEDLTLAEDLILSEKERAEHLMLVDLERNDLGRCCDFGSVRVSEFMNREKYSHVIHIVSTVTGKLRSNTKPPEMIAAMFPGGTITGTPKIRSMEIIDELESHPRNFYTGSLGWISASGSCEFNILIRSLLLEPQGNQIYRGTLNVGAGIVADSDPSGEYSETLHKAGAWLGALRLSLQES